jgi:hypothetical protein
MENWVSNPEETHGPLMVGSIWALTGISGAFLALRLYIRRNVGKLWIDDILLILAWVSRNRESAMLMLTMTLDVLACASTSKPARCQSGIW